ncbi:phage tail protein [Xenorhabdus sp. SF857]|uniref:phage tail protein n=1 Tax=Xenorhabdus bakwenae TaxID=3026967 RepID=UPI00255826EB|nr:phage tail protein [Xenorhabdus sp. SF857]WFQ80926.1 phage tail protein [Xenorhabdus sp. SF857]
MSTKFFALLTRLGADKLANAAALGTKLNITHMAVGDGGGKLPTPDTAQTKLVNERRRAAINVLSVDPKNTNQIMAEQVIPENEGGWWIREIGLFDKDGILIAVGNCAETYKPQLQEGSGRTQTIRMVLIVSHTDAVTLKIDPSVVLATREYADAVVANAIREHEQSRRHPDATLKEKGFVILNSAVNSNSETQAATPKAVKAAYDLAATANNNANSCLEKNKNGADIPNKPEFVKNLGLTGTVELAENAYSKTGGVVGGHVDAEGEITGNNIVRARSNLSTVEINASESSPKLTSRQGNGGWNSAYIPQKNGTIAFLDDIPAPITPTTIAQSTGQSTTSIMSQQATTRVLETKFSKSGGNIDGFVSVAGEITGTNIVRARSNLSVIELNASDPQPQLTSRIGNNAWFNARIPQKNGTLACLDDIPAPTRIAQSTGTATDVVMSQKSVTDAISAHGVGYAQSWVHVTTSRVIGAWYVNDTNRPIFVVIAVSRDTREGTEQSAANISFKQGGDVIHIPLVRGANSGGAQRGTGSAIIPVGAAYSVTTEFDNKITNWWELR